MMNKQTYRHIQSLLLLSTILVLSSSFYFEYAQGMQPCPLCFMQRICTFILGMCCMMGLSFSSLRRALNVTRLQLFFTAFGMYFAGRQLWLQSLPRDNAQACMPSLDSLIHYFSKDQVLKALFWGTGDCGEDAGQWLGFSIPGWSALYFLIAFLICSVIFVSLKRSLKNRELI